MSEALSRVEKTFFESTYSEHFQKGNIHLLGFLFDGTSCFRKGADQGPDAIREVSDGYESFSPYLRKSLEDINLLDLGNLPHYPQDWIKTNTFFHHLTKDLDLIGDNIKLVTMGGEHSISYGPIRLHLDQYKDLVLIHLDAHADLRDGYQDYRYSHASIIKRVLDHFSDDNELIQYGIRSGLKEEFDYMQKLGSLCTSRDQFFNTVKKIDPKRPIYLTLDLDYFDPAFVPGTGTPEAGGEDFGSLISLLKILKDKNFVGADVVELAPRLDPSNNSACFAAKVIREIILSL